MSDVRLTATNPVDSSVVPVACNERGELLVTKTVIEEIDNNVIINGSLFVDQPSDIWNPDAGFVSISDGDGNRSGQICHYGGGTSSFALVAGGYRIANSKWKSNSETGSGVANGIFMGASDALIDFCVESNKATGSSRGITSRFKVTEAGGTFEALHLGPLNDQKGITINVGEELALLKSQVSALMERLNMSSESGWEVSDESAEA